ncbi:four helix bundle protein [Aeoliella sp. SH292]|uniref:four helix bundle protein n=1 Tax=Aeoliella sp. SH292 TaxID=3454464 RepID=UPI003F964CCB
MGHDRECGLISKGEGGGGKVEFKNQELRDRTKAFALRIIRLTGKLPRTREPDVIARQLLRSGTSVAANYREASRARSDAELISKLGIVEQELDESLLWMELLVEAEFVKQVLLADLMDEADQLLRITVASIVKVKKRKA